MDPKSDAETTHVEKKESLQPPDTSLPTTPFVVLFALFIALSGWLLNFDMGYSGTVLQMDGFKASFGTCAQEYVKGTSMLVCTISALQQGLTNVSSLFVGLGAIFSGLVGSWVGRRTCIQIGCLIQAIGAAGLMGTAGNFVAYNACKSITGFGLGLLYTSTIPYGIELLPPHRRGALTALFGVGLSLGSNCIALVCLGSSLLSKSDWAWKTPVICEIPIAMIYGSAIMLFPESPRWLVIHGQDQLAVHAFVKVYKGNITIEKAQAIVADIKENIARDLDLASSTRWTDIFQRLYIGRLLVACMMLVATILCGVFFVHMYAAIFFGELHVSQNPFVLTCIIAACGFPGACAGPFIADGLGRRRAQLTGYSLAASLMLVIGVVNTCLGSKNPASVIAHITLLSLWSTIFAAFVTSTAWLLASELQSVRLRTYGQAFVMSVCFFSQFASNFYTPYMINPAYGDMGVDITYFFFGLSVVFLVLIYLFVPETGQLSLEQLDEQLGSKRDRALRTSLRKNREIARGHGHDNSVFAH